MFDSRRLGRAKLPIFSTISFAAVLLVVVCANSFISSLFLATKQNTLKKLRTTHENPQTLRSSSTSEVLLSVRKDVREASVDDESHYVPPFNLSDQERTARPKKKLPELEIFGSTNLTRRFDDRIQEFLGDDHCRVQFFMTWISPASSFGEREFLAVESLYKAHPNGCLVILSRTMDSARGCRILKPILDSGFRVLAVSPDFSFLFQDTPAESWFDDIRSGQKDPGEISLAQNLSNLIRLAVLYKYGGVYLDTDFIVLRDFSGLRNSIGAQSVDLSGNWTRLNNAVLIFEKNHPLLHKFMEEFANTFDGNRWGHNGPYLVSRVVAKLGNGQGQGCNFTILLPRAFYPVDWIKIKGYFAKPANRVHSKWVEAKVVQLNGATYGVHLWNRQTSRLRIEEGSVMDRLISRNCVICKKNRLTS